MRTSVFVQKAYPILGQLTGEAIAAFQYDNNRRLEAGEPAVESKVCSSYKIASFLLSIA